MEIFGAGALSETVLGNLPRDLHGIVEGFGKSLQNHLTKATDDNDLQWLVGAHKSFSVLFTNLGRCELQTWSIDDNGSWTCDALYTAGNYRCPKHFTTTNRGYNAASVVKRVINGESMAYRRDHGENNYILGLRSHSLIIENRAKETGVKLSVKDMGQILQFLDKITARLHNDPVALGMYLRVNANTPEVVAPGDASALLQEEYEKYRRGLVETLTASNTGC